MYNHIKHESCIDGKIKIILAKVGNTEMCLPFVKMWSLLQIYAWIVQKGNKGGWFMSVGVRKMKISLFETLLLSVYTHRPIHLCETRKFLSILRPLKSLWKVQIFENWKQNHTSQQYLWTESNFKFVVIFVKSHECLHEILCEMISSQMVSRLSSSGH